MIAGSQDNSYGQQLLLSNKHPVFNNESVNSLLIKTSGKTSEKVDPTLLL